ncbi:hypothetical protein E1B28_002451 [Marasmius oreades]|uniref:Uncharacterized protein n=1 Tax=Marasmius oreades TaxID=181124 RepID=A0A9P7RNL9_9AGAR|nr:uncharacterized protein E1B28_002451 [Marasmius oreades]KAG7086498.1 hypothetical protein E1B28_002451 [Marasmius oreades]
MFARLAVQLITVAVLAICSTASPLASKPASALGEGNFLGIARDPTHSETHVPFLTAARTDHSFDGFNGISSLDNFDNFYGVGNFHHAVFDQVVVHDQEVVCHTEAVEIIQQRLVVLQEMAKRIITEQICEVETQTVVFSQFHASLGTFYDDLRRHSSHQVGFDDKVVGKFPDLVQSDGSLSTNDLGFTGSDVGSNTVVPTGNNWDDTTSPDSVDSAYFAAQSAQFQ